VRSGSALLRPRDREVSDGAVVLVAADDEETRDGIERLLRADGYRVQAARSEDDAVERAAGEQADLILVSLAGAPALVVASAVRIRRRAGLGDGVPVVVFGVDTLYEGAEEDLGYNVYATCPDNFDQLRSLLGRLLNLAR
jgi:CheY-like chemotaxis protein